MGYENRFHSYWSSRSQTATAAGEVDFWESRFYGTYSRERHRGSSIRLATVVSESAREVVLFLLAAGSRNGDGDR